MRSTRLGTTVRRRAHAPVRRGRALGFLDTHPWHTHGSTRNPSTEPHPLAVTFLAVAAFSAGCNPSPERAAADNREATAQRFDKVQRETPEAAQEMTDYTYAQKAEFVEKLQTQLAEINQDSEQLSVKIEKSSDAVKAEAKPNLQALRGQTAKLNKRRDEARSATESTWNDVKAAFKKGCGELKEGFQQTRQWANDTIAPRGERSPS